MRKLYRQTLQIFWRSKYLSIPYLILLALISLYLGFSYLRLEEIFDSNIVEITKWVVLSCIFLVMFFFYLGYELAVKVYDNDMAEYFAASGRGYWKAYQAFMLCLLTLTALPFLMFFAFNIFIYVYLNIQYHPFLVHLVKLSVLYFGLFLASGGLLGLAAAAKIKTKRLKVYSFAVILLMLNTKVTEIPFRIPYLLFNSSLAERLLYYVKDFFAFVPYEIGSTFRLISLYGYPMEPIRWVLAVFWLMFPLILVSMECFKGRTKKRLAAAGFITVLAAVGLFSLRGSTLLMDYRNDSYVFADQIYYMDTPVADYTGSEAGFKIRAYEMNLKISNELHAEVKVAVDNPGLESYDFTLYHGYRLKSVSTARGKEMPFTREGDYITLGSLKGEDTLIFKYYGKSPIFYANSQAVTLPGYFVYYPQAGRKNIWGRDGYSINVPPEEMDFTVNIRSNLRLFCNLEGSGNSFAGRSNALTLFAGMYAEVEENLYAEPLEKNWPKRKHFREAEAVMGGIFAGMGFFPEAAMGISSRKIFLVPHLVSSSSNNFVVMNDHIITSCYSISSEDLAEYVIHSLIKAGPADYEFKYEFIRCLFNREDKTDPLYQEGVNPKLLLKSIVELRDFNKELEKYGGMDNKSIRELDEQERETFSNLDMQMYSLRSSVNETAAKYLFRESPHRDENKRIFMEYFTTDTGENYLDIVERIVREDLQK